MLGGPDAKNLQSISNIPYLRHPSHSQPGSSRNGKNVTLKLASTLADFVTVTRADDIEKERERLQPQLTNTMNELQAHIDFYATAPHRSELTAIKAQLRTVDEHHRSVADRVIGVDEGLTRVEEGLTRVEEGLTGVEERLTRVEAQLTKLPDELADKLADKLSGMNVAAGCAGDRRREEWCREVVGDRRREE